MKKNKRRKHKLNKIKLFRSFQGDKRTMLGAWGGWICLTSYVAFSNTKKNLFKTFFNSGIERFSSTELFDEKSVTLLQTP